MTIAEREPAITCACGYNLRGLPGEGNCPECGQAVADARRRWRSGSARRLFASRVSLGIILLVWSAILLAAPMFAWRGSERPGLPLGGVNFAGPKVWAAPLAMKYGTNSGFNVLPVLALVFVNALGVWLVTSSPPRRTNDPQAAEPILRVALRGATIGGLAVTWIATDASWSIINVPHAMHVPLAVSIELPCTLMLYFHLAHLAQRMDRHALASRLRRIMWLAAAVAAITLPSLLGALQTTRMLPAFVPALYGIATVVIALTAVDLLLELRHELVDWANSTREGEPDAA